MAVQINWGLDRAPDFAANAQASFQSGQDQAKQQVTRNALAKYGSDPQGSITQLMSVDPVAASQLRQGYAADQAMQRQQQFRAALGKGDMAGATQAAAGDPQLMQALDQVHAHMKALNDAQAAGLQAVAGLPQEQRAQAWDNAVAPRLVALGMDPAKVASNGGQVDFSDNGIKAAVAQTMSAKDQLDLGMKQGAQAETQRHDQATEAQAQSQLSESTRHDKADEANTGMRNRLEAQQMNLAGWQVLQDPASNQPYRYNVRTGQALDLQGQPYQPSGAAKIQSGMPRSAQSAAVQRFLQENPSATADDISKFNADYHKQQSAATAFGTGKQGQAVNSLNVAVSHLALYQQLANAAAKNDIQTFNRIAQAWGQEFGSPAPTNLSMATQVMGTEVEKAVLAGGGSAGERESMARMFNPAMGPAQAAGAADTARKLLGGQLTGLRLQYKNTTGLDDFETHLTPDAQSALETHPAPQTSGGKRPSLDQIFGGR